MARRILFDRETMRFYSNRKRKGSEDTYRLFTGVHSKRVEELKEEAKLRRDTAQMKLFKLVMGRTKGLRYKQDVAQLIPELLLDDPSVKETNPSRVNVESSLKRINELHAETYLWLLNDLKDEEIATEFLQRWSGIQLYVPRRSLKMTDGDKMRALVARFRADRESNPNQMTIQDAIAGLNET